MAAGELHRKLELWRETGNAAAVEEWRQRQVERMFSLSEFVKRLKFRFTRWYNARNNRTGVLWESRFTSVIVEEEERALRTMAVEARPWGGEVFPAMVERRALVIYRGLL